MSTKKEQYITEMEKSNILMNKEMTFVEYVNGLVQFQDMITKKIMGDEYEEGMRVEEAISRLESKARAKGNSKDPQFRKGITALRTVSKELAISIAGKRGEDFVARTLEYVTRPNTTTYRNVYVSNEEEETELDNVILTDNGIIILEVKNTKDDIIITEQGRLERSGNECYDKKPLCEKMQVKRRLLQERMKSILDERGIDIPLSIESFIVFSTPKNVRVNVEDRLRKEKWCFRTGLINKINGYVGRVSYSEEQIAVLGEILGEIETQVKSFSLASDFNLIRSDIAGALATLEDEPVVEEQNVSRKTVKRCQRNIINIKDTHEKHMPWTGIAAMIGIACASVFGASAFVRREFNC